MKLPIAVLSAVLAAACAGCIVEGHSGHVSAGAAIAPVCDHHYVFYPDHGAYSCGSCGFWWLHDGGAWIEYRSRPSHIHVSPSVVVVEVEERGPSPWVHYDSHVKKVPRGHGPPPGRGWNR